MHRAQQLATLATKSFDLCIIGGGASGAGAALDAALRGYSVCLIEKEDFAADTSSRSTKLIHGGVRYLEQAFKKLDLAQLKQVRHGLSERRILLDLAPHLARPLPILTPVRSYVELLYYAIGLKLYGWFARHDKLPKSKALSRAEALRRMPTLSKARTYGAVLYYDGQLDDARYCLALAQAAAEEGACVLNHITLTGFEKDARDRLQTALLSDQLSGAQYQVQARFFLNCTGPAADTIRQMANSAAIARIRPSKGVHAVLPGAVLQSEHAMLIPKTPDGRVIFAIPYEGAVLLGTTDTPYESRAQEPLLEAAELDYLIETLQPYLSETVDKRHLKAGFAGVRPLISASGNKSTKRLLRDHEVEYEAQSGLLSLLGGKWTTYRLMAKDAVDQFELLYKNTISACKTDTYLLPGATDFKNVDASTVATALEVPLRVATHLCDKYGSRVLAFAALLEKDSSGRNLLHSEHPYIAAEVQYAVEQEMACTLRDFLARRIRLEITDWQAAHDTAPAVALIMGKLLHWSESKTQQETADYQALIRHFQNMIQ
ncbi:MAG: FAD-dependent oxidoreductase [Chitinophagales bacterium]|nr:FAD-dependent oxidoreductase [Chitinophagales bacterium]